MGKSRGGVALAVATGDELGEDEVEQDSETLVTEAVTFIQDAIRRTLERGLLEIGDYVFNKFFRGDPEQVRSKAAGKGESFRSLLERCETLELPLKKSSLYHAVSIAATLHELGAGPVAFKQLPHSHQVALLPVRDPKKIEKLATRAISKKLSVRDLRAEVAEERASANEGETRGRKPDPLVVRMLKRAATQLKTEGRIKPFTNPQVDELDDEQKAEALKTAQQIVGLMEGLIVKLQ